MKILKIVIFLTLTFLLDRVIGLSFEYIYSKNKTYNITKLRKSLKETDENILIFGSSRATHHYIPKIIRTNTQLSCYNCGFEGHGLKFVNIQIKETLERYCPKIILVDIVPTINNSIDYNERLNILYPYAKKESILNKITENDLLRKIKLQSWVYHYNSEILELISGNFPAIFYYYKDTLDGYLPLSGNYQNTKNHTNTIYNPKKTILEFSNSDYFNNIDTIINSCAKFDVQLIFAISPIFSLNEENAIIDSLISNKIFEYNKKYPKRNVIYLNSMEVFNQQTNYSLFKDNLHLNNKGAFKYSSIISVSINNVLTNKDVKTTE